VPTGVAVAAPVSSPEPTASVASTQSAATVPAAAQPTAAQPASQPAAQAAPTRRAAS
jgi:hypothetical protein